MWIFTGTGWSVSPLLSRFLMRFHMHVLVCEPISEQPQVEIPSTYTLVAISLAQV